MWCKKKDKGGNNKSALFFLCIYSFSMVGHPEIDSNSWKLIIRKFAMPGKISIRCHYRPIQTWTAAFICC